MNKQKSYHPYAHNETGLFAILLILISFFIISFNFLF